MNYWLIKSEPETYSILHLKKDRQTVWDGVRNYQARNFLRQMQQGDKAFFYHSNTKIPGISSFFGMDLIVSSLVLWVFVFWEGSRLGMKNLWIYVASNLLVGVSLGLPLFLLMRQRKLDQSDRASVNL